MGHARLKDISAVDAAVNWVKHLADEADGQSASVQSKRRGVLKDTSARCKYMQSNLIFNLTVLSIRTKYL